MLARRTTPLNVPAPLATSLLVESAPSPGLPLPPLPAQQARALEQLASASSLPQHRVQEVFTAALRSVLSNRDEPTHATIAQATAVARTRLKMEEKDSRAKETTR